MAFSNSGFMSEMCNVAFTLLMDGIKEFKAELAESLFLGPVPSTQRSRVADIYLCGSTPGFGAVNFELGTVPGSRAEFYFQMAWFQSYEF